MEQKNIILIDFYDSFTFNLASEVHLRGGSPQVLPFDKITGDDIEDWRRGGATLYIFGPGPGHPEDYKSYYPLFRKILSLEKAKFLGVCLGHQIIWNIKGVPIKPCTNIVHGQKVPTTLPPWKIFPALKEKEVFSVQRYNSLELDCSQYQFQENEALFPLKSPLFGTFTNGVTYQFHPESIGTSFPSVFFRPFSDFLYNGQDEEEIANRRNLRYQNLSDSREERDYRL